MNCGTCRFFQPAGRFGMCQRYPEGVMKQESQWCGEHQRSQEPVIDDREPQEATETAKKRRGRPPKDDQTSA